MKISRTTSLTFVLVLTVLLFLTASKGYLVASGVSRDYFAKRIIKVCSKDPYKPACYDKEIPKVLAKGFVTMEGAFDITSRIQKQDRSYLYCHVLGHKLADLETSKDPSKWLDVITECPTLACNNGCAHGAIMRKFKGTEVLTDMQIKEILPDLNIACEPRGKWNPTELERSMCYHSMGHLGLYITGADIDKSIKLCNDIGTKADGRNYYQTCVSGVFMLVFQSLDLDDAALVENIKPKKEDVQNFCNKYNGTERMACFTETWPYFFDEFKKPSGLVKFCKFAENESKYFRDWCYDTGLRGGITLRILQDQGVSGVSSFCLGLPDDIKERCFASVANSWVQDEPHYIKESVELCNEAGRYGHADSCFNGLLYFSKFSFNKGTKEWEAYCGSFPDKYKEKCISGEVPNGW